MNSNKLFTENELAVMKILWSTEKPLSRSQILERTAAQELTPTSFHFAINSLLEKGYVQIAGFERCGKNYGRAYSAAKTREDFILDLVSATRPDGQKEDSVTELMAAFVKRKPVSPKTISELEKMLAEHRRELAQKSGA